MDNLHSKSYKNRGKGVDDLRRQRQEISVELRKNKREEVLLKRRNIDGNNVINYRSPEVLASLVVESMSPNTETKFEAIKTIRSVLSSDKNPPIDEIIEAGILPILVDALKYDNIHILQFEAAWALTNIASGNSMQTRKVVEIGAIPLLIKLLESSNDNVAEQCLWALGNIIGDGPDFRDLVIQQEFIKPLHNILKRDPQPSFLRNLSWVLVNLCRSKSPPLQINVIREVLPILISLIETCDANIVGDVIWAVSYITDYGNSEIQTIIDSGIVSFIVPMLKHEDFKIQTPALRVIGNIVTGTDEQTQFIIDLNVLPYFPALLNHNKDKIKKEALWFLSNVTAGSVEQIQTLINHNIIPTVIKYLDEGSFMLQKEAAWVISNMLINGNKDQVKYLVENRVIEPICKLLTINDSQILKILLEGIIKIFDMFDPNYQEIADEIEKCGGIDTIEDLQNNSCEEVYRFAYQIVDKYFDGSTDDIPNLLGLEENNPYEYNGSTQFEF